jgi:glycosyltransferase involved in cell wall biosynthesis
MNSMDNQPEISVLLPVYNGQRYLRESIDSLLAQSFQNFELIIWDDQSTDESSNIIAGYDDPRIRRFANPRNRGLFKTLNSAIEKARAPLIRLWSQDDIMKRNCLEEEVAFLARHPDVGMSYCPYDVIDEHGNLVRQPPEDPTPEIVSPALAAQIMFYHGSITGNIANVMLKKSVLEKNGGFREDLRIAGDFEMWVRISETRTIGHLCKPMIYLRDHAEQFSRQAESYVTCMSEEHGIYEALLKRQPPSELDYARKYDRRHRYLQYVHFMIRSFLFGNFKTAIASYQAIRRFENPSRLIGWWILTADRRLFKMKSKYELGQGRLGLPIQSG